MDSNKANKDYRIWYTNSVTNFLKLTQQTKSRPVPVECISGN